MSHSQNIPPIPVFTKSEHPEHGMTYVLLIQGILERAVRILTPGKLLAVPHIYEDESVLEFKRNTQDEEVCIQKISESEQLVYVSYIGMPIENLWVRASIERNLLSRNILEVPPEYIEKRNNYVYTHYQNRFQLTQRINTLVSEYALHLWILYSLEVFTQTDQTKLTSGRILFLALPFVSAALRDFPLDIYTHNSEHANIHPYVFLYKLLNKINQEELTMDQKTLYNAVLEQIQ